MFKLVATCSVQSIAPCWPEFLSRLWNYGCSETTAVTGLLCRRWQWELYITSRKIILTSYWDAWKNWRRKGKRPRWCGTAFCLTAPNHAYQVLKGTSFCLRFPQSHEPCKLVRTATWLQVKKDCRESLRCTSMQTSAPLCSGSKPRYHSNLRSSTSIKMFLLHMWISENRTIDCGTKLWFSPKSVRWRAPLALLGFFFFFFFGGGGGVQFGL